MTGQSVYVGVDVSKQRLEVALRPGAELLSVANDERAISQLVRRLRPLNCVRIVVEATGVTKPSWRERFMPPVCRWW